MRKLLFSSVLFFFLIGCLSAQTVYVTKTGKKYHTSGCSYLSRSCISIELKEAQNLGYTPCSRCSPATKLNSSSILKTNSKSKIRYQNISNQTASRTIQNSRQCQAITKKGAQCKRKAKPGSNYCWQHSR